MSKKPYICPKAGCNKKYTTRFSLRRHLASHQSKRHTCHLCNKTFALSQYLKEHMYIHTGQKPFVCTHPGCGRSFRQAGKLSMHRKIHQNVIFTITKVKRRQSNSQEDDDTLTEHFSSEENSSIIYGPDETFGEQQNSAFQSCSTDNQCLAKDKYAKYMPADPQNEPEVTLSQNQGPDTLQTSTEGSGKINTTSVDNTCQGNEIMVQKSAHEPQTFGQGQINYLDQPLAISKSVSANPVSNTHTIISQRSTNASENQSCNVNYLEHAKTIHSQQQIPLQTMLNQYQQLLPPIKSQKIRKQIPNNTAPALHQAPLSSAMLKSQMAKCQHAPVLNPLLKQKVQILQAYAQTSQTCPNNSFKNLSIAGQQPTSPLNQFLQPSRSINQTLMPSCTMSAHQKQNGPQLNANLAQQIASYQQALNSFSTSQLLPQNQSQMQKGTSNLKFQLN